METVILLVVVIVCLLTATSLLFRAIFGQRAAATLNRGLAHTATWIGRQIGHFIRWTLRRHWMFWAGLVAGILVDMYFTGRLTLP